MGYWNYKSSTTSGEGRGNVAYTAAPYTFLFGFCTPDTYIEYVLCYIEHTLYGIAMGTQFCSASMLLYNNNYYYTVSTSVVGTSSYPV